MILSDDKPGFNEMQNIKRRFFALRNGVIADVYRRSGSPYKVIFGLTLVQLREVAASSAHDRATAMLLRANDTTRESRLLWPMLVDAGSVNRDETLEWLSQVMTCEEADVLCNRLLRNTPFAADIAAELYARPSATDLQRYAAVRMMAAVAGKYPRQALEMAQTEMARKCKLTLPTARMLADDAAYIIECEGK